MGVIKYDKAHMASAEGLIGKRPPFASTPFVFGGLKSGNPFARAWSAAWGYLVDGITSGVLAAILFAFSVCRSLWPVPRIGRYLVVTREADARQVLGDDATFAVPYTPEMIELAGGVNALLGTDGAKHAALSQVIGDAIKKALAQDIGGGETLADRIRLQSGDAANALLDNSGGRIDVMTDLFTRTYTETTFTFFGFTVANPVEFAHWTMAVSRLLFGDPTGNAAIRAEAMNAAPRLQLAIDQAIAAAKADPKEHPHGLIRALLDVQRGEKAAGGAPLMDDDNIRATVVGLIVALIPTNTLAAGKMLEEIMRPTRRAIWDHAIALAKADTPEADDALQKLLLEAGRLNPALSPGLWRYVKQDGLIGGQRKVRANDVVLVAIPTALRDPRWLADEPDAFRLDRPEYPMLMFGHGPHFCIGNHVAMAQTTEIFKALLARVPEPVSRRATQIGPFPVHLDMRFAPDRTQSTMIIISAPAARQHGKTYAETRADIEQAIALLGNPAGEGPRESLTATGVVHFASLSVVEANADDSLPPVILFEINADGPVDEVLAAIVAQGFEWLAPVFAYVTDRVIDDPALLVRILTLHAHPLHCAPGDPTGLHFNGMRQFPVRAIARQERLATFARKTLDRYLKTALGTSGRASDALAYVRDAVRKNRDFAGDLLKPSRDVLGIAEWRAPATFTGPFFRHVLFAPAVVVGVLLFVASWVFWFFAARRLALSIYDSVANQSALDRFLALRLTDFTALVASFLATTAIVVAIVVVLGGLLAWHEQTDVSEDRQNDLDHARKILALENHAGQAQNHIIAVMPMKRGWFRRLTLAFALWGIKQSLFWFRPGFVVTMGTIHYAKWFIVPGTDRFVFMSNYDGSWESYLEDFITRAHWGQSAAWSNGFGFPMTRWLINYGADDGDRFKRWVRNQQRPTLFWYCRFPDLTAEHIRTNALIQDGLVRATTSTESRAWLSSFGSQQRQEGEIEADEVQSLVFSGQPRSVFSTCILLTVPSSAAGRARWMAGLTGRDFEAEPGEKYAWLNRDDDAAKDQRNALRVTYADHNAPGGATFVAFTDCGLAAMGLPDGDAGKGLDGRASFPPAFRIGMAERAHILGDVGAGDPANWHWADVQRPGKAGVDAALFVYGAPADPGKVGDEESDLESVGERLTKAQADHRDAVALQRDFLEQCSGTVMRIVETGPDIAAFTLRADIAAQESPIAREHFGFRDGISQPVIRGTRQAARDVPERDILAPGEFILGYRNNQDYFPPALTVRASDDLRAQLPTIAANAPQRFPAFGAVRSESSDADAATAAEENMLDYRDFGRNGTFLVIRDLEQDVEGFAKFTADRATAINKEYPGFDTLIGRPVTADWVASKMVGRWRDGSSLVGNPHRPGGKKDAEPDNDFSYGIDDPRGLQCPLGAHVRRANPRDSLQPGDPQEQPITNRHRLLRRGRTYVQDVGVNKPVHGLLFACLCADIERQFEFVQQTWLVSPSFHSLRREADPVMGGINAIDGGATEKWDSVFTIPTAGGAITVKGMESYVTTRGGGYFFLPSRSALLYLASLAEIELLD